MFTASISTSSVTHNPS